MAVITDSDSASGSNYRSLIGRLLLLLSLVSLQAASGRSVGGEPAVVRIDLATAAVPEETSAGETTLESLEEELRRLRAELDSGKSTYPRISLGGLLQAEAAWIRQNDPSISDPLLGDLQDHRGIRRSRLTATGKVADNVSMMLDLDFSLPGRPTILDVVAHISDVPLFGTVSIGQFRQPFGLSELSSVKELPLFERPITFAMSPFRQIGVGFSNTTEDKRTLLAASVYGSDTDRFGNSFGDGGIGTAERLTSALMLDDGAEFVLHVGLGHAFLQHSSGQMRIRTAPEYAGPADNPLSLPAFIDTGVFAADASNIFNAELAGTWGPLHAESELRVTSAETFANGTVNFPAAYAQCGWILTGEHRPYKLGQGVLGRVRPATPLGRNGGLGALEAAFRWSWMDLNDNGLVGGELVTTTWGLNWYLNDYTKLQFNWVRAELDSATAISSATDLFALRMQLDF